MLSRTLPAMISFTVYTPNGNTNSQKRRGQDVEDSRSTLEIPCFIGANEKELKTV
jgi:hypothetical protein